MNRDVPEGLSSEVCGVVLPIRAALAKAGWTFGRIQWEGTGPERKLSFRAKSPTGGAVYIACSENDLAGRLEALLDLI